MDILDVILAKSLTPQGQIDSYAAKAKKAVNDAKKIVDDIEAITEQTNLNNENSQTALENAQAAATEYETIAEDIDARLNSIEKVEEVAVENDNTSSYKGKKIKVKKNGILSYFNAFKNYISTGSNEDGSMTQKAITDALNNQKTELENKIKNIKPSGGGSGNISGNISAADEGSIVSIDENGNIQPSSITEADVILTQIITGTYKNDNIVGLELDYTNKTYTRLQAAQGLTAGADFDQFIFYGGRKRCVVNANGTIAYFLTGEEDPSTLVNKRIMVYQPAFYYLRVPLSVSNIENGIKINKEHLYLSAQKYAGFTLHPLFRDENGNALRYVLLPAFESGTYKTNSDSYELEDTQNVDLTNDCLVSIINTKPISGATQEFTLSAAKRMCENNGQGWKMTNLAFESANQMLMMVEYGSPNLQNAFNPGITQLSSVSGTNYSCNTGSTLNLLNSSGQALSTISVRENRTNTYTAAGQCAISYRGLENPYGNMWRFIDGVSVVNNILTYKNQPIDFKIAATENWINAFGFDKNHDWVYLPIEVSAGASSNFPVGDYYYPPLTANTEYAGIAGGYSTSNTNSGIFYYAFNISKTTFHYQHDTARVMYIPTPDSVIDNNNYNLWHGVV